MPAYVTDFLARQEIHRLHEFANCCSSEENFAHEVLTPASLEFNHCAIKLKDRGIAISAWKRARSMSEENDLEYSEHKLKDRREKATPARKRSRTMSDDNGSADTVKEEWFKECLESVAEDLGSISSSIAENLTDISSSLRKIEDTLGRGIANDMTGIARNISRIEDIMHAEQHSSKISSALDDIACKMDFDSIASGLGHIACKMPSEEGSLDQSL